MRVHGDADHLLHEFFEIAAHAIRKEDMFLRRFIEPYLDGAYSSWTPGFFAMYETGMVYFMFRELIAAGYPKALSWELSYPEWAGGKLDLAVYSTPPSEPLGADPEHAIEVKRWVGNSISDERGIWCDLLKLLYFEGASRRYVFLLTAGPNADQLGEDVGNLTKMKLGQALTPHTIETLVDDELASVLSDKSKALYKATFDRAEEVLWAGFDTKTYYMKQGGHARLSLIEVFAKPTEASGSS